MNEFKFSDQIKHNTLKHVYTVAGYDHDGDLEVIDLSGAYRCIPSESFKDYSLVGVSSGVKHDQGKPDLSYISYEFLAEMAKVREFGAKKYSRNNWQLGFKVTRSCAAALRHIYLYLSGQTYDEESGLLHLAHAACCLEHAIWDQLKHPHNDDRGTSNVAEPLPKKETSYDSHDIVLCSGTNTGHTGGYADFHLRGRE